MIAILIVFYYNVDTSCIIFKLQTRITDKSYTVTKVTRVVLTRGSNFNTISKGHFYSSDVSFRL